MSDPPRSDGRNGNPRSLRVRAALTAGSLGGGTVAMVVVVGSVVRLRLIPLTNGDDFVVWDLASRATLAGRNVYAHHPVGYPGGPFAYLPLFLYIELPLQWLAIHLGLPFRVLGKMPMLVADIAVAVAIAAELRRRGRSERLQALGAALWFWNPLLVYNSAYYGRFDSVCVALLFAAVCLIHRRDARPARDRTRSYLFLGAAIATKLFPVVLLPWFWTRRREFARVMITCLGVCTLVALPYLIASPGALYADVVQYNANKPPSNLTWQTALRGHLAPTSIRRLGLVLTAGALTIMVLLRRRELWWYTPIAIGCFLLSSNLVIEQYFLWPLPFLIVLAVGVASPAAGFLIAWLSVAGMVLNTHFHPFGRQGSGATEWLNVAIAVGLVVGLVALARRAPIDGDSSTSKPQPKSPRHDRLTVSPIGGSRPTDV